MANSYFKFKNFTVTQDKCAMKVCTDACLFGAWVSDAMSGRTDSTTQILDIGTGTGLLSLMVAQTNQGNIHAVELNSAAYEQASENVRQSPWSDRICFYNAAIQNWNTPLKFDFIISNPPFYENDLKSPDSVRNDAMHGTGLAITELLDAVRKMLSDNGTAYLLLPLSRVGIAETEALRKGLHANERVFIRHSTGKNIFRAILSLSFSSYAADCESEITIHDEERNYTSEFRKLLMNYYLNL